MVIKKNVIKAYGEDNWGNLSNFKGNYINFGYWKDIVFENETISLLDRIKSSQALYKIVCDSLEIESNDALLEIGCGKGGGTFFVAQNYDLKKITAIDCTPEQIKRAQLIHKDFLEKNSKVELIECSGEEIFCYGDDSIDKVFSVEVAQHFASLKKPLKNSQGEIIGIIGHTVDITDKKRSEVLEKEKELATRSADLMNLLAGLIAHELRTPLASIKANLNIINNSDEYKKLNQASQKFFQSYIDRINLAIQESVHMTDMILVKLKNLAKGAIASDDFSFYFMETTLKEVMNTYPFVFKQKSIIHIKAKKFFTYKGDNILTKHVFYNLIKNSFNAIKESGKGEIYIDCLEDMEHIDYPKDKYSFLSFKDTAKGISSHFLPRVFSKFETSDFTNSGSGLGLAFCKLIMKSYGGDIICESEEGGYAQFILIFPKV